MDGTDKSGLQATKSDTISPTSAMDSTNVQCGPTLAKEPLKDIGRNRGVFHGYHWRVPFTMAFGLLLGVVLPLLHHFLFSRCHMHPVITRMQQQIVSGTGITLAFMTKAALALATSTSYTQTFWCHVRRKPQRIEKIDSMFSALNSAFCLLDIPLWFRAPLLALLAILAWLTPLATIVTPGSMTVATLAHNATYPHPVGQFDPSYYDAFWKEDGPHSVEALGQYPAPSNEFLRIAYGVAYGAARIPTSLHPPGPNSSYTLEAVLPKLLCKIKDERKSMHPFWDYYKNNTAELRSSIHYLAWAATKGHVSVTEPPEYSYWSNTAPDRYSNDTARLFILASLGSMEQSIGTSGATAVAIECGLYNVSQTLDFSYQNNTETISTNPEKSQILNAITLSENQAAKLPNSRIFHMTLVALFNSMVTGSIYDHTYHTNMCSTKIKSLLLSNSTTPLQFKGAFEDLFENITLSLLAGSQFSKPQTVNVTVTSLVNFYVYKSHDLLMAYGISILCTAICVTVGIFSILENKTTFTNNFSTILRTTRNSGIGEVVSEEDSTGADPLPRHVARAVLRYCGREGEREVGGFDLVQVVEKDGA
ncbi:hypothetical protein K402DRAFT_108445 [Aulographum hederae CBS 113979]|uniref:Uncharacterized protein n=1 Tax=Aulographum hederae CBS 113979 TaxID=1176131 RepID=A0A6G1GX61_9PEZI|nr:hypothetical protein K402DRAFT_108445 [Aulographum hederae CBS 113979]